MQASDFLTFPSSLGHFAEHFPAGAMPWDWIKSIEPALAAHRFEGGLSAVPAGVHIEGSVYIHSSVKLPPYCTIIGPAWIGAGTEIRPGAYIRGKVIIGDGCVVGNSCEFKNCLLLDRVQVPHFSYVGDSILGNRAHLGAGVICSNLRLDQREISLTIDDQTHATGLRKFGAIVGDDAEVGCNAVLMPGTLLGKRALVMPLTPFGGYLAAGMITRDRPAMTQVPRRD